MQIITDQVYEFSKDNKPCATAKPGEVLQFNTQDCFSNRIPDENTTMADLDYTYGFANPAAGPVYIEGAEPGDVLAVDFVPWVRLCDMEAFLNRRRKLLRASLGHDVTWDDMLRGMVLAPVADVLLEAAALDGARPVAKGETVRMAPVLKGLRLPVTGLGDVKQCQVHRGGVSVRAVDDRTCEVRRVPGLYVVGEALDVDAACGGFNLHWAWASGLLAGWSAAERLRA